MRRQLVLPAALLTVVSAVSLAAPATASTMVSAAHASTPRCTVGVLHVATAGADVGAGVGHERLVFTNVGRRTCTLAGHPGVSYVAAAGRQIGAPAERTGRVVRVTLAPKHSATADLTFVNVASAVTGCTRRSQQTTAVGLRVYPPGSTRAVFVRERHPGCRSLSVHLLRVGALHG